MSCTVADRKRVEWAARSVRLREQTAAVDILAPGEGEYTGWTLEATLADVDCVRPGVYGALEEEDLDLELVQPRGEHYVVIATA